MHDQKQNQRKIKLTKCDFMLLIDVSETKTECNIPDSSWR